VVFLEVFVVTYIQGNIFQSPAQVLTNTVNCVGVMGKGIALEFKNRYEGLFDAYKALCVKNAVVPGKPYLWENEQVQILNFPTKRHWKDNSRLDDIEAGLKYLAANYATMGIDSLAMPALGCGNGGLNWNDVQALIDKYLGSIIDLDVYVYLPQQKHTQADPSAKKQNAQLDFFSDSAAKPADI
jgi:O-acetyl-ADP-ribose deacetylase (regulator of RNase III)